MSDEDDAGKKLPSSKVENPTIVKFPDKFKIKETPEQKEKTEKQQEEEHKKSIKNQLEKAASEDFSDAIVLALHSDGSLYTSCSNMDPLFFLGLIETCKQIMIKASMQLEE